MPLCTQDSNKAYPIGDSVESTDSETYIPTGKLFGYPLLIFTDLRLQQNLNDSDTRDSVTEGP